MGHVTATRELAVTPEAIWATISDTGTWDSWLTIHAGWLEEPPAQLTTGAKLVEKVVMLGMANKLEWTVTAIEPGASMIIEGKGMAGVTSRFSFNLAPNGEDTTVTIDAQFAGSLIVGALGKAVEKDAAAHLNNSLDKLAAAASA